LADARRAAARCRACPLYKRATQTVFGEGPLRAELMFVGEQPGDREDLTGKPLIGPAGRLLDEAIAAAGLDRSSIYVTNAVKHFKWEPERKRRRHVKPNASEIAACKPWLELEIALVKPRVVVALGATAAQTLMGAAFRVTKSRGRKFAVPWAGVFLATVHPSSILRAPSGERELLTTYFIRDLVKAKNFL
jgi:DNA polymerase